MRSAMFLFSALRGKAVTPTTSRSSTPNTSSKMADPEGDGSFEPPEEAQQPMDVSAGNGGADDGQEESLSDNPAGRYVRAARESNQVTFYEALNRFKKVFKRTFTGAGTRDTTESSWPMFKGVFVRTAEQLDIPQHLWASIAYNLLDGPALKSLMSSQQDLSSWEAFDGFFAAGPFQQTDTDYSVRVGFYDQGRWRVAKPHQVHGLLRRCEVAFSKAPNPMTDIEKIVAVHYNLPEEVQREVMVNNLATGGFTRYEDFRVVLLTKVNAMPSGSGSGGRREDNHPTGKRPRSSSNPRRNSQDGNRRRSMEQQQRPDNGGQAGPSGGNGNNGGNKGPFKPCTGCGSTKHQVNWMDRRTNQPVCPNYDPQKAAVSKRRQSFQKA